MNELTDPQAQVPAMNPMPAARASSTVAPGARAQGAALTLANKTTFLAQFRICQGSTQVARVGVHQGGSALVPMGGSSYTVQAMTSLGDFSLTSNTVQLDASSVHLVAQVMADEGYFDFQVVQQGATQVNAIVCENTWRTPVVFKFTRNGSPVQITTVVDEHDSVSITTAQQWTVYAIVNGITTQPVQITDPRATLTVEQDSNNESFRVTVS